MATDSKEIRELLQRVEKLPGWRVERRSKSYVIFPPDGQTPFSAPHGPRQPGRAIKNLTAHLRRAGATI